MKFEFDFQTTTEVQVVCDALLEYASRNFEHSRGDAMLLIREMHTKLRRLITEAEVEAAKRRDDGIPY